MSWQGEQRDAAAQVAFVELRSAAEQTDCPYCHAPAGATCTNGTSDLPVKYIPAHNDRIKKARG